MPKKDKDAPPPGWLLDDFAQGTEGRRPKRAKPLKKRSVAAEPTIVEPDQLITKKQVAPPNGPDIKAPAITVDADRGRIRTAWGKYRSDSMATAICAFARTGLPDETIQAMMGITSTQFHNWMSADPDFARDYMACRGTWENAAMTRIAEIADARMDWKAWAWLMEKNNPSRWGPNATPATSVEVPMEGAIPVNLDPVHVTTRLEELVAKAKAAIVAAGHDPEAVGPITIETTTNLASEESADDEPTP